MILQILGLGAVGSMLSWNSMSEAKILGAFRLPPPLGGSSLGRLGDFGFEHSLLSIDFRVRYRALESTADERRVHPQNPRELMGLLESLRLSMSRLWLVYAPLGCDPPLPKPIDRVWPWFVPLNRGPYLRGHPCIPMYWSGKILGNTDEFLRLHHGD